MTKEQILEMIESFKFGAYNIPVENTLYDIVVGEKAYNTLLDNDLFTGDIQRYYDRQVKILEKLINTTDVYNLNDFQIQFFYSMVLDCVIGIIASKFLLDLTNIYVENVETEI